MKTYKFSFVLLLAVLVTMMLGCRKDDSDELEENDEIEGTYDCHNYSESKIMSKENILSLRSTGYKIGRLRIINNYAGTVTIEIYHPDSWLDGTYTPFNNIEWNIEPNMPNGTLLLLNSNYFNIGEDWGIRVTFLNEVKSCIRTVYWCCKSVDIIGDQDELHVYASDIFEGTWSW